MNRFGFVGSSLTDLGRLLEDGEVERIVDHIREDLSFDGDEYDIEADGRPNGVDLQDWEIEREE